MKPLLRSLVLLLLFATGALGGSGFFLTRIIRPGDQVFEYYIPARHTMRVLNFIQDVQTFANSAQPGGGFVIQPQPAAAFKVRLSDATTAVNVLTATFASQSETQKDFTIAGPATIRIEPLTGANVTVTFIISRNW